jgi:hypothetical protein
MLRDELHKLLITDVAALLPHRYHVSAENEASCWLTGKVPITLHLIIPPVLQTFAEKLRSEQFY